MSMSLERELLMRDGNWRLFRVVLSSHLRVSLASCVREHSVSMCHSSCIRGSAKGKLQSSSMFSGEQQWSQYRCDLGMPLCRPVSIFRQWLLDLSLARFWVSLSMRSVIRLVRNKTKRLPSCQPSKQKEADVGIYWSTYQMCTEAHSERN